MSKLDKFRDILKIGSAIGKPFIPPQVGSILDEVNKGLADDSDPANAKAITDLANDNDQQTAAILALHERVKRLEAK